MLGEVARCRRVATVAATDVVGGCKKSPANNNNACPQRSNFKREILEISMIGMDGISHSDASDVPPLHLDHYEPLCMITSAIITSDSLRVFGDHEANRDTRNTIFKRP